MNAKYLLLLTLLPGLFLASCAPAPEPAAPEEAETAKAMPDEEPMETVVIEAPEATEPEPGAPA